MTRRHRLLSLTAVTLLVAGCPGGWLVADDSDNSNIITTSRGSTGGGATFSDGTNVGSQGGTGFSCTSLRAGSGTESDASTGTNPTSVSLSDPVQILPLYLGSGNVSMSVTNAKTAVVSMASLDESFPTSVQTAWSGSGVATAYNALSGGTLDESPQNRAERLVREHAKTLRPAPVSASYRAQAGTSYSVGASRTFQLLNLSPQGGAPYSVATKAAYVYEAPSGQKGSFVIWVDANDQAIFQGSGSKLQTIAAELRDRIYKTDTCAFGSDTTIAENEALPASKRILLNDDYVHFVFSRRVDNGTLTDGDGTLGYFTLADLADSDFNRGKVLYIASSATSRALGDMFAVIAHEFQHLLFSCHRVKAVGMQHHINEFNSRADTWLNEGLSMLAMMLNGYGPDGAQPSPAIVEQVAGYLQEPSKYSMTAFYEDKGNPQDAYGMVTLFAQYLNDRLGDAALKDFHSTDNSASMYNNQAAISGNVDPTDLADRVLAKYGTSMSRMFADFGAAVLLDGAGEAASLGEPLASRYQIRNVNLHGKYADSDAQPIQLQGPAVQIRASSTLILRPYSLNFLKQTNLSGTVNLGFSNVSGGNAGYSAKLILSR